jgi:hypothetical protein
MPEPVKTSVSPNGMRMAHFEKPYWSYTINGEHDHPWTTNEPYGRVPSVTGILGVLDKSRPLVIWATNITCEGAWKIGINPTNKTITEPIVLGLRANADEIANKKPGIAKWLRGRADAIERDGYLMPTNWRQFQRELGYAGLDHHHVVQDAQLRGTEIHKIGEDWVNDGRFPNLKDYALSRQGYARAMARFLSKHGEGLSVAEQIVGSAKHGFAGTCDTVAVATFGDSRVRLDYKTARNTYARTHFRQLAAYELAAVEGGSEPTDRQAVVILGSDGEFSISFVDEVDWPTSPEQSFLDLLKVYCDEQPLKKHEEAQYRARRKREQAKR